MSSPQPTAPTSFSQGYTPNPPSRPTRKEILNYSAPWPVYGLDWSNQPTEREALRLAVGSFIEDGSNKVGQERTHPLGSHEACAGRGDASYFFMATMLTRLLLAHPLSHVDSSHYIARVCWH